MSNAALLNPATKKTPYVHNFLKVSFNSFVHDAW